MSSCFKPDFQHSKGSPFTEFRRGKLPPIAEEPGRNKASRKLAVERTYDSQERLWVFSNVARSFLEQSMDGLCMRTGFLESCTPSVFDRKQLSKGFSMLVCRAQWKDVPDSKSFGEAIAKRVTPACQGEGVYRLTLSFAEPTLGNCPQAPITFTATRN